MKEQWLPLLGGQDIEESAGACDDGAAPKKSVVAQPPVLSKGGRLLRWLTPGREIDKPPPRGCKSPDKL